MTEPEHQGQGKSLNTLVAGDTAFKSLEPTAPGRAHYLGFDVTPPDFPRKIPKQSRSSMLFASLLDSCEAILREEGEAALKMTRVSEVAGVCAGSIYQYFPNVDALLAATHGKRVKEEVHRLNFLFRNDFRTMCMEEFLTSLIDFLTRLELDMLSLGTKFHKKYHRHFKFIYWYNEVHSTDCTFGDALQSQFQRYPDQIVQKDLDRLAMMFEIFVVNPLDEMVEAHSEYLVTPEFSSSMHCLMLELVRTHNLSYNNS